MLVCVVLRAHYGGNPEIAAILVADVVGHGRLAATDEDRTLSRR